MSTKLKAIRRILQGKPVIYGCHFINHTPEGLVTDTLILNCKVGSVATR